MKTITVIGASVVVFFTAMVSATPASPYMGQEQRQIKSLSAAEITDYLAGKGMGMAKAAELNHYPGPSHVLELATALNLSTEQKTQTQAVFKNMQERASRLGRLLVEEERRMDAQFSSKTITPAKLETRLARIGNLQAQIRQAHLEAHLTQVNILSSAQIAKYVELRGYTGVGQGEHVHKH